MTLGLLSLSSPLQAQGEAKPNPQFERDIAPVFNRYCVSCHNLDDREGGLDRKSTRLNSSHRCIRMPSSA